MSNFILLKISSTVYNISLKSKNELYILLFSHMIYTHSPLVLYTYLPLIKTISHLSECHSIFKKCYHRIVILTTIQN